MKRKDEILFVMLAPTLDSAIKSTQVSSGADMHAMQFLKYCQKQGIKTRTITNELGSAFFENSANSDVITVHLFKLGSQSPIVQLVKTYVLLPFLSFREMRKFRDMKVIGATALLPDALAISLSSICSNKESCWVYFHHSVNIEGFRGLVSRILQIFSILALKFAKANFFVLPSGIPTMQRIVGKERIFEFQNGVDPSLFARTEEKKSSTVDALYVGRLSERKGSRDLIKIWESVVRDDRTRRLTIAGAVEDDKFQSLLERSPARHNIDVLGQISESKKISLLKSARCFISPSREEGWGLAVAEAIAAGLSVIVFDLNAYAFAGNAIKRISVGNIGAFSEAILNIDNIPLSKIQLKSWDDVIDDDLRKLEFRSSIAKEL